MNSISKRLLILLGLQLCSVVGSVAQSRRLDSLLKKFTVAKDDTNKIHLANRIANIYYNNDQLDSSILFQERGVDIARTINNPLVESGQLGNISFAYMGVNFLKSLEYGFKSLSVAEKAKDPYAIGIAYLRIGQTYRFAKEYKQALSYLYLSKNTLQKVETGVGALLVISNTYEDLNRLDSALMYAQEAYKIGVRLGDLNAIEYAQQSLATTYLKMGANDKALSYFRRIPIGSRVAYGIAQAFYNKSIPDSAIYYAQKAYRYALKRGNGDIVILSTRLLSDLYKNKNEPESYKYYRISTAYKDSLFNQETLRKIGLLTYDEQQRQRDNEAAQVDFRNQVKQYALLSVLLMTLVIAFILWRNNRQRRKAYSLLQRQKEQIQSTLAELKSTQAQLIQKEKLASLGELTAGIAHEIQNPLNFVNNFSEVSAELVTEMQEELDKGDLEEAKSIADDLYQNLQKINHHGQRASSIVKGMLEHSRATTGKRQLTDINKLADEYLRLSYHGLKAKDNTFSADYELIVDENMPLVNVVPQEIGRVLLNLINNAFYAVNQRAKSETVGYQPKVTVSTKQKDNQIQLSVQDNGPGIPTAIKDKIFQPFFTTKPTGEGTGLGLSLSYDIVTKGHDGTIEVETKEGEGTTFLITI